MNIEQTIADYEVRQEFRRRARSRKLEETFSEYTERKPGEPTREEIARATEAFLASGGAIKVLPAVGEGV